MDARSLFLLCTLAAHVSDKGKSQHASSLGKGFLQLSEELSNDDGTDDFIQARNNVRITFSSLSDVTQNTFQGRFGPAHSRKKRSAILDKSELLAFNGSARITEGVLWDDDLMYTNTSMYQDLERRFLNVLDVIFSSTSMAHLYAGAQIQCFSKGSINVLFTVSFTLPSEETTTNDTATTSNLTGAYVTERFLEAASNLTTNFSLDMNSTEIFEIVVNTDSSTTASTWTALLSSQLQLVTSRQTIIKDSTSQYNVTSFPSNHAAETSSRDISLFPYSDVTETSVSLLPYRDTEIISPVVSHYPDSNVTETSPHPLPYNNVSEIAPHLSLSSDVTESFSRLFPYSDVTDSSSFLHPHSDVTESSSRPVLISDVTSFSRFTPYSDTIETSSNLFSYSDDAKSSSLFSDSDNTGLSSLFSDSDNTGLSSRLFPYTDIIESSSRVLQYSDVIESSSPLFSNSSIFIIESPSLAVSHISYNGITETSSHLSPISDVTATSSQDTGLITDVTETTRDTRLIPSSDIIGSPSVTDALRETSGFIMEEPISSVREVSLVQSITILKENPLEVSSQKDPYQSELILSETEPIPISLKPLPSTSFTPATSSTLDSFETRQSSDLITSFGEFSTEFSDHAQLNSINSFVTRSTDTSTSWYSERSIEVKSSYAQSVVTQSLISRFSMDSSNYYEGLTSDEAPLLKTESSSVISSYSLLRFGDEELLISTPESKMPSSTDDVKIALWQVSPVSASSKTQLGLQSASVSETELLKLDTKLLVSSEVPVPESSRSSHSTYVRSESDYIAGSKIQSAWSEHPSTPLGTTVTVSDYGDTVPLITTLLLSSSIRASGMSEDIFRDPQTTFSTVTYPVSLDFLGLQMSTYSLPFSLLQDSGYTISSPIDVFYSRTTELSTDMTSWLPTGSERLIESDPLSLTVTDHSSLPSSSYVVFPIVEEILRTSDTARMPGISLQDSAAIGFATTQPVFNMTSAVLILSSVTGESLMSRAADVSRNESTSLNVALETSESLQSYWSSKATTSGLDSAVFSTGGLGSAVFSTGGFDSAVFSTGGLDSAVFSTGGLDSAVFSKRGLDSAVFSTGGLGSAAFSTGGLDSAVFSTGGLDSAVLSTGGPSAAFSTGRLDSAVFSTGGMIISNFTPVLSILPESGRSETASQFQPFLMDAESTLKAEVIDSSLAGTFTVLRSSFGLANTLSSFSFSIDGELALNTKTSLYSPYVVSKVDTAINYNLGTVNAVTTTEPLTSASRLSTHVTLAESMGQIQETASLKDLSVLFSPSETIFPLSGRLYDSVSSDLIKDLTISVSSDLTISLSTANTSTPPLSLLEGRVTTFGLEDTITTRGMTLISDIRDQSMKSTLGSDPSASQTLVRNVMETSFFYSETMVPKPTPSPQAAYQTFSTVVTSGEMLVEQPVQITIMQSPATVPITTTTTTSKMTMTTTQKTEGAITFEQPILQSSTDARTATMAMTTTGSTALGPLTQKVFMGTMKVVQGAAFTQELQDRNSPAYKELELQMLEMIRKILEQSGLSKYLDKIVITGFSQGSVIVYFELAVTAPLPSWTDLTSSFNEGYFSLNDTRFLLDSNYTEIKDVSNSVIDYASALQSSSSITSSLPLGSESSVPVSTVLGDLISLTTPENRFGCLCTQCYVNCSCNRECANLPTTELVLSSTAILSPSPTYVITSDASSLAQDTPKADPCQYQPCPSHSKCLALNDTFLCSCNHGYALFADRCLDVDECQSSPCPANAQCSNTAGSYFCACLPGFSELSGACVDVDECLLDLCQPFSNCTNSPGSYFCSCQAGFEMQQELCKNVDECLHAPCPARATCLDTEGSYVCVCSEGLMLENATCLDINECLDLNACPLNAECLNTDGSWLCACLPGFTQNGSHCEDENECNGNICGSDATCLNIPGGYECHCVTGFQNNSGLCQDVDECRSTVISPCGEHADCLNIRGSYTCVCRNGFQRRLQQCADIDECKIGFCPPFSQCQNTIGNYSCLCQRDFFQANEYTCLEDFIDETKTFEVISTLHTVAADFQDQVDIHFKTYLTSSYYGSTVYLTDGTPDQQGRLFLRLTPDFTNGTAHVQDVITMMNISSSLSTAFIVRDVNECNETQWSDCSLTGAVCLNNEGSYTCECSQGFMDYSLHFYRPGRLCSEIDDAHQQMIQNLTVLTTSSVYEVGSNITFTIGITKGSHVTYVIHFGDGHTDVSHTEILSFLKSVEIWHIYHEAKVWSLTVNGSNALGSAVAKIDVRMVEPIRNLTLEVTAISQFPISMFHFVVSPTSVALIFEDVTCVFSFDDGTIVTVGPGGLTLANQISVVHSSDLGAHDVSVECSNIVSHVSLNSVVVVEEIISGLGISADMYVVQNGEIFRLFIETSTGTNVVITVDFGDGRKELHTVGNNIRGPAGVQLTAKYSKTGRYVVNVYAENALSTMNATLPHNMHVLNVVKDLVLTASNPIAYPLGIAYVTIMYTQSQLPPTDVTCRATSLYLQPSELFVREIQSNLSIRLPVQFINVSAVGVNVILMNCSNAISFQTMEFDVVVEAVIQNVSLSVSSAYIVVSQAVDVQVKVDVASHARYVLDFGDGRSTSGAFASVFLVKQVLLTKQVYSVPGFYTLTAVVSNHVSAVTATAALAVLEEITDVTITAWYKPLDNNETLSGGYGPNGDIYPLEREVMFKTSIASGNDVTYRWYFGDGGAIVISRTIDSTYRFQRVGLYQVFVNASNALSFDTYTRVISLQETVLMHTLTNDGPAEAYMTLNFTLTLARVGTNPCYIWDMGDNSEEAVFGGSYCTRYSSTPASRFILLDSAIVNSNQLYHRHMYQTNGTFLVTIRAYNLVSEGKITNIAVISGISCRYPNVHLVGGGQQIDKPVVRLRSDWINFESTVDINCRVTQEADFSWKVDKIFVDKSFLDFIFEPVTVDSTLAGLFKILFGPGAFDLGTYRVSLNVSMRGIPGLFHSDLTYFRIDPSPLVTHIRGGNARSVGYDKTFVLDAASDSYDPDIRDRNDKKDFTFEWFCRRQGEALPADPPLVSMPTNSSRMNFTKIGGCFGTGAGRLRSDQSGILWVDSFFLMYQSVNVFTVWVRKGDRLAVYEQAVTVVEGDPPDLKIECVTNCKSKVNPSEEFTLLGKCLQCLPTDTVTFRWALFVENDTGALFPVSLTENSTTTGLSSAGLSFTRKVLTGGRKYRLHLSASRLGYASGFSELHFLSNEPPYGGDCRINPEAGYALDTLFVISCEGWLNPGDEQSLGQGLLYRFWVASPGEGRNQLLYYGTYPFTPQSQLPLGSEDQGYQYDVMVRISNPIGEYVERGLKVKVSYPPLQRAINSFLNLTSGDASTLSRMVSTGREQEAKQLVVTLASLLNSQIKTRATSQSSTTWTTTTKDFKMSTTQTIPSGKIGTETTTATTLPTTTMSTNQRTLSTILSASSTVLWSTTAQYPSSLPDRTTEEKQQLTQLRTQVVTFLSKMAALTLDSLQQTARAVKVITDQTDEISEECQNIAVNTMKEMTNSLKTMVQEARLQSVEQELTAAVDIVASLGNILMAATDGLSVNDLVADNETRDATLGSSSATFTNNRTSTTTSKGPDGLTTSPLMNSAAVKREQVRGLTRQTLALADTVAQTVLQRRVPGAPPVVLESRLFTISVTRSDLVTFNNSVFSSEHGSFVIPSINNFKIGNDTQYIDSQFITRNKNPFIWDVSAQLISSPVISLTLYGNQGEGIEVSNLSQPIEIGITTRFADPSSSYVLPLITGSSAMYYHTIGTKWNTTQAITVCLTPKNETMVYDAFFKYGSIPTLTDYDFYKRIPSDDGEGHSDESRYKVFITRDSYDPGETETLYMGIRKYVNVSKTEPDYSDYYVDTETTTALNEFISPYTLSVFSSSCRYWDEVTETWSTNGCQVSPHSTSDVTQCLCTHLTSFGAGVYVAPNKIHFDTIFTKLDQRIAENSSVIITLGLVFSLYFVGVVWTRHMDKKDVEKVFLFSFLLVDWWGATPLADNVLTDRYFYRLTVFTGMRNGAGTKSRVSFILSGDKADTGVRQLVDQTCTKILSRGSVNQYILGVPGSLGPLSFLRVWHDNSGKGHHQGWYLNKWIITDLQTDESFIFLCNRWLAVEEDDGSVDRILPVASKEDLLDFHHLFFSETKRSLTDSHLWFSVFSRPRRSAFSRLQRLSCILSLLLASMMANAMYYRAGEDELQSPGLEIGPVKITMQEVYVSLISSIIVLPLNVIIDQLFRRSRPKISKTDTMSVEFPKPSVNSGRKFQQEGPVIKNYAKLATNGNHLNTLLPNVINDIPQKERIPSQTDGKNAFSLSEQSESQNTLGRCCGVRNASDETLVKASESINLKTAGKTMLPHWCVYIAWFLVLVVSAVSAFIIFSYSMEWGRAKSLAWLSSVLLCVGQSVVFVQPVKIIILALAAAWVCRKSQEETEEAEELVDSSEIYLLQDEEPLTRAPKMARRPLLSAPPPSPESLSLSREQRLKELAMARVTREIIAYLTYLILLLLVALNNHDSRSYLWTNNIRGMLNAGSPVSQIRTADDFWKWTKEVLVPSLYIETDYRGSPLAEMDPRLVKSMVAYRLGPVRLRQHRVTPASCSIPFPFTAPEIACTRKWSWDAEDTAPYLEGWELPSPDFTPQVNSPWIYMSWVETNGIPFAGTVDVYPAGGYVKDLVGKKNRVQQFLLEMENLRWLDKFTRSVFVEFVLYNPNVNLFAMVTVLFETPITGTYGGEIIISSFRLFSYLGTDGIFVAICESLTVICTLYFASREARKLWKEGRQYVGQFWNWVELGTLLGSIITIVMYVGRHFMTSAALKTVKTLQGRYYNFQKLSFWNNLFSSTLAFVLFLSILKTIHLLRFNRRVSVLGCTLKRAAKELTSFSFVFLVVYVAFFSCGFLIFGSQLPQYSRLVSSFETLMAVTLGQPQLDVLRQANGVLGPFFFFLYTMSVVFVLLNVFLTILNEAINAVRQDVALQSNEHEIIHFMWTTFWNWVGANPFKIFKDPKESYVSSKTQRQHPGSEDNSGGVGSKAVSTLTVLQKVLQHFETDFSHLDGETDSVHWLDFQGRSDHTHGDTLETSRFCSHTKLPTKDLISI